MHVTHDGEVSAGAEGTVDTSELGALELEHDVVGSRAGPVATVRDVCPFLRRVVIPKESSILNFSDFGIFEFVDRNIV